MWQNLAEANQAQFKVNAMVLVHLRACKVELTEPGTPGVSPSTGSVLAQAVAGPKEGALPQRVCA